MTEISSKKRISSKPIISFLRKLFPKRIEIFFDEKNLYIVDKNNREQSFSLGSIKSVRKTFNMINDSMIWEIEIYGQAKSFTFTPGSRLWNSNFKEFLDVMNSKFPATVK